MSIFSNILAKIFPSSHPAVVAQSATPSSGAPAAGTPAPPAAAPATVPAPAPATAPATAAPPVDVEAVISAMPGASTLNWKTSIVDLLKVLGLDSSLESRQQLAHELGYAGNTSDSAAMNIWLHAEVVAKLRANGGKVPDSIKG